jgi:hypothetical protein
MLSAAEYAAESGRETLIYNAREQLTVLIEKNRR